jgi:hypothetical protein
MQETLNRHASMIVNRECMRITTDVAKAYYRVPLHKESQGLCGWKHDQLYRSAILSLGLSVAPLLFAKIISMYIHYDNSMTSESSTAKEIAGVIAAAQRGVKQLLSIWGLVSSDTQLHQWWWKSQIAVATRAGVVVMVSHTRLTPLYQWTPRELNKFRALSKLAAELEFFTLTSGTEEKISRSLYDHREPGTSLSKWLQMKVDVFQEMRRPVCIITLHCEAKRVATGVAAAAAFEVERR